MPVPATGSWPVRRILLIAAIGVTGWADVHAAGVDVLAHTTLGVETPWPDDLRRQVVAAGMAVIPTLKLMGYELGKEQVPAHIAQMQADIVVLDADPAAGPANFAKVRCTIRGGAAIYMSPGVDRVASDHW